MSDDMPFLGGSDRSFYGEPRILSPASDLLGRWQPGGTRIREAEVPDCVRDKPVEQKYCGDPKCPMHMVGGVRDKLFGVGATEDEIKRKLVNGKDAFPERGKKPWYKERLDWMAKIMKSEAESLDRETAPLRSCHRCGANTNSMLDVTYKPTCGMCYKEMRNRGLLGPNQQLIPTAAPAPGSALALLEEDEEYEQQLRYERKPKKPAKPFTGQRTGKADRQKSEPEFIEPTTTRARIPETDEEV